MHPIEGARINEMDHREAMARPAHFEPARFERNRASYARFLGHDVEQLAALVEDAGVPIEDRYAVATLLALRGDPRVQTDAPEMVALPGGEFTMGTEPAALPDLAARYREIGVLSQWLEKETPSHTVKLPAFRIAKYPVTNAEYRAFLEDTRLPFLPTSWRFGRFPEYRANHPVYSVSPAGADAYAAWLAGRTGRAFRLPSEAEWEYAAGGVDDFEFPWGDSFDSRACNTLELGVLATTPVGMLPQGNTRAGVADLAGNVEELVQDTYRPYPGGRVVEDDIWRRDPGYRMTRGGGFTRFGDLARRRRRHGYIASELYAIGFRLCEHGDA